MTGHLTLDVLALIIEQLAGDKHMLLEISVLQKEVYSLALPALYRSNDFLDLKGALRFCHAILHHPESPGRFVHRLYLQVPFWGIPSSPITPDDSEFELIRMALGQMQNLQELSLFGFSLFNPIDLSNCPFKLKYLLITPPTNEFIARLIRNQPTIVELNVTSFTLGHLCVNTDHFLGPEVLPNLSTVTGCPRLIGVLAPGRPIAHVLIQICGLHTLNKADILSDIASLDRSTTPIKSLYVDLDGHPEISGWNFVEHLRATKVPSSLVCLTIKANLLDFATHQAKDPSYLYWIAQLLRGFTSLRYFEVEEAIQGVIEERPAAHEIIDMMFAVLERQIDMGALWRQNCPSLVSVKFFERDII
ncbi:unnamed protein product [Rhizoctonia solani]|uniref:Uncharacterized protein n=1 Tax=Rhizoctonia solani TaxID=456999 RepID=A0A8H3HJM0_9AGAM|nr:unnamed protein product [Rhizoctonia solani]